MTDRCSMRDALALYSDHSLGTRIFVRLRHLLAPLARLEMLVPNTGEVLDLGCGHGLFSNYMAMRAPDRDVVGIDPSPEKARTAMQTDELLPNTRFMQADLASLHDHSPFDVITIVDVLYLIPEEEQRRILENCHRLLKDTGSLVLKVNNPDPFWRFSWGYAQELLMVKVLAWTQGPGEMHFLSIERYRELLTAIGFTVECRPLPARVFYPSVALICKKG